MSPAQKIRVHYNQVKLVWLVYLRQRLWKSLFLKPHTHIYIYNIFLNTYLHTRTCIYIYTCNTAYRVHTKFFKKMVHNQACTLHWEFPLCESAYSRLKTDPITHGAISFGSELAPLECASRWTHCSDLLICVDMFQVPGWSLDPQSTLPVTCVEIHHSSACHLVNCIHRHYDDSCKKSLRRLCKVMKRPTLKWKLVRIHQDSSLSLLWYDWKQPKSNSKVQVNRGQSKCQHFVG